MLTIGSMTVDTVTDIDPFALPIGLLFPNRSIDALRPHEDVLAPYHVDFDAKHILLGVQSHLVRANGRTILIDTCVGEHKDRAARADWNHRTHTHYLQRLADHGLTPDDIDIVMCTHLHADHVGWNTKLVDNRWVPTFPNARYLVGRREFDFWRDAEQDRPRQHNHASFVDSVMPIVEAGQIDLVDDGFELAPGLSLKALPGHTPGQMGLCLCHAQDRVLMCADAVHSIVQVFNPHWATRFCSDPEAAVATRLALFEDSVEQGTILVPAHLRHFDGLRVRRRGNSFVPDLI